MTVASIFVGNSFFRADLFSCLHFLCSFDWFQRPLTFVLFYLIANWAARLTNEYVLVGSEESHSHVLINFKPVDFLSLKNVTRDVSAVCFVISFAKLETNV